MSYSTMVPIPTCPQFTDEFVLQIFFEESGTSIDACGAADTERIRIFAGMSNASQLSIQVST